MAERVLVATTKEKRVEGILYWVKSNEDGFLEIWASVLARGGRPKKKKKIKEDKKNNEEKNDSQ